MAGVQTFDSVYWVKEERLFQKSEANLNMATEIWNTEWCYWDGFKHPFILDLELSWQT